MQPHCSRLVLVLSVAHASTFLPAFAPRPLRRFSAPMRVLTPFVPFIRGEGYPRFTSLGFPAVLSPTTLDASRSLWHVPSASRSPEPGFLSFRLSSAERERRRSFPESPIQVHSVSASPLSRGLANVTGRIEFLAYGPAVRFPLLSTPPSEGHDSSVSFGDAVTFGFSR